MLTQLFRKGNLVDSKEVFCCLFSLLTKEKLTSGGERQCSGKVVGKTGKGRETQGLCEAGGDICSALRPAKGRWLVNVKTALEPRVWKVDMWI